MFSDEPSICIPLLSSINLHPRDVGVIGMYVYRPSGTTFVNFSHPDSTVSNTILSDIKLHPNSLVLGKKALLHHGFDQGIDLNSYLHYYIHDSIEPEDFYPKSMGVLYNKFYAVKNITSIIPLSKLIEFAEGIVLYVLPYFKPERISDGCREFCEDFTHIFHMIESNDVCVGNENKRQNYMWYTATSRPSNSWAGFNLSALNKNDGTRSKVHSRFSNGKLVQFDYDAFHIKLLAKILDYKFVKHPYIEINEELGLNLSYDETKSKVFQNIYGNITDPFRSHPFFMRVQAMIDELYSEYERNGYIESYFYNKRFREIGEPTPNKVFNYFLQSLETEYNVRKIKTILPLLSGGDMIFSMYLYDAFVFDVPPDELGRVGELKRAFETDGMTTKCVIGTDFGNMVPYL